MDLKKIVSMSLWLSLGTSCFAMERQKTMVPAASADSDKFIAWLIDCPKSDKQSFEQCVQGAATFFHTHAQRLDFVFLERIYKAITIEGKNDEQKKEVFHTLAVVASSLLLINGDLKYLSSDTKRQLRTYFNSNKWMLAERQTGKLKRKLADNSPDPFIRSLITLRHLPIAAATTAEAPNSPNAHLPTFDQVPAATAAESLESLETDLQKAWRKIEDLQKSSIVDLEFVFKSYKTDLERQRRLEERNDAIIRATMLANGVTWLKNGISLYNQNHEDADKFFVVLQSHPDGQIADLAERYLRREMPREFVRPFRITQVFRLPLQALYGVMRSLNIITG